MTTSTARMTTTRHPRTARTAEIVAATKPMPVPEELAELPADG